MMWNYPYGYMNAGWFLQPFISVIVTVLVIVFIFRLLNRSKRHEFLDEIKDFKDKNFKSESPLDILKKRYAKGEIDKKEFEEKKKDLE